MAHLRLFGVKPTCDTVRAIKEIRRGANIPLNEALALVNRMLGKQDVFVDIASSTKAKELAASLREIGMLAEVSEENP